MTIENIKLAEVMAVRFRASMDLTRALAEMRKP